MKRTLVWAALGLALAGCSSPVDPCDPDPAPGRPAFDLAQSLRNAGAEVEELGERLELTLLAVPARELRVEGEWVLEHRYCTGGQLHEDVSRFSDDASTFDGVPATWQATPHIFVFAEVLAIYDGEEAQVVELLTEVMGEPVIVGD